MAGGFESLGLMPELLRSTEEMGWHLPTDVQDEAIPLILGGGDVMAASETGTGKTGAFCLPVIQVVHERLREDGDEQKKKAVPKGPPDIRRSDSDRDALLVVSPDGKHAASTADKIWAGARATHGVKGGSYYYEATIHGNGICRLGWSSMAAHLELGKDAHGFGYGGTGKKSLNNGFEDYGEKYVNGDTIGCYLNWGDKTVSFSKNGKFLGPAFQVYLFLSFVAFTTHCASFPSPLVVFLL
jgi:ATP-dependent RNA helicase DDX1